MGAPIKSLAMGWLPEWLGNSEKVAGMLEFLMIPSRNAE